MKNSILLMSLYRQKYNQNIISKTPTQKRIPKRKIIISKKSNFT